MAKLYFFYGAMNSGKTTRILQCEYNYKEQGMRAVIMKPQTDTKGNDKIVRQSIDDATTYEDPEEAGDLVSEKTEDEITSLQDERESYLDSLV